METNTSPKLCSTIVVGITGAVAAAWMPERVFAMRQVFASNLHVVLTEAATKFVSSFALSLVSGNPALMDRDMWTSLDIPHISLAKSADIVLIMPASAATLSRCASARNSDLLSTLISAVPSSTPVVFVPSMNENMWRNPLVSKNVKRLRSAGYHIIEPVDAIELSNGEESFGGMVDLERLFHELKAILAD
ncbi:flavoprotein [Roseibium album]|uniref:flavoprotein n=1 Tax=Roseibium album TaxID=311410 RepID=UPI00391AF3EA